MNPFTALVNFLGQVLAFFFGIVPNYGIAIILLTLVISLLLFPLTLKQTRSMKAMQEIQPEVKRLQKEYKDDREEMQKQLMALYQERGVNPAAGCLPLLLQMPIWFALFSVLRVDVENAGTAECVVNSTAIPEGSALQAALCAENTHFLGMDLLISPSQAAGNGIASAIPYIILVLIVVAAGFYQQMQTTRRTANSPQQQAQPQGMQTALKIMPIFFGFISWGFPTGLVVYFATSNLFRIAQQSVILRLDREKEHDDGEAEGGGVRGSWRGTKGSTAEGSSPPDEAPPTPPRSQPSPHASKKRKKRRRK